MKTEILSPTPSFHSSEAMIFNSLNTSPGIYLYIFRIHAYAAIFKIMFFTHWLHTVEGRIYPLPPHILSQNTHFPFLHLHNVFICNFK